MVERRDLRAALPMVARVRGCGRRAREAEPLGESLVEVHILVLRNREQQLQPRPPHPRHHQPRPARMGPRLRRHRRRRRHLGPAHAQGHRLQHPRPQLATPRTPRPPNRRHRTRATKEPLTSPTPTGTPTATRLSLSAHTHLPGRHPTGRIRGGLRCPTSQPRTVGDH